jgi:hypothetical protein
MVYLIMVHSQHSDWAMAGPLHLLLPADESVNERKRRMMTIRTGRLPTGSRTPRWRNAAVPARRGALLLAASGVAMCFTASVFGQGFARPDGSVPLPADWSSKHVLFTAGFKPEQAAKMWNEPRVLAEWLLHGYAPRRRPEPRRPEPRRPEPGSGPVPRHPVSPAPSTGETRGDWAVSLGAGGVAQGMSPAKYTFDVNAPPSCTSDYVAFPINASTGNTRARVIGTFTGQPSSGQTTTITVTPTGDTPVSLVLTAGNSSTGLTFARSFTTATNATNLAAAINRNLGNTVLYQVAAVASLDTVTVYALTPGTRVRLTVAETLNNFSWAPVTAGTNGAQANIVAFNQLYTGTAPAPLCTGFTNPEFIFSYASGVGPVETSPTLSISGTEISYVENDPNIGAILHVLTFGSGSTEYGAPCAGTNNGTVMPTCATDPVIPGSTAGSTAKDFMLPLGLVAANAATGVAGAADSFSSPFVDYADDTTFVGDNNGYLYEITPTFIGTPAYAGGNFPVHVSATPSSATPTAVTATTTVVTITVNNTLSIGELATIAGVTSSGGCAAGDVSAINGTQMVMATGLSTTQFEFAATIPAATSSSCTVTNATVTPASNYLSAPVVDVSGTGNIFVGDSSANLYELTPAGATAATALSLGNGYGTVNGGIHDGPIIDSTNQVGYVVTACSGNTVGETNATNAALVQFSYTSSTLTLGVVAGLDTNAQEGCSVAGYPTYDPTPDYRYYVLGIGSATAASNGEIIAATSGSGGQQLKTFQFVGSTLQATPEGTPQFSATGPSPLSPLTEFYNSQAFTVTGVTATTTVVTVTAANTLAANDTVTLSNVAASAANNCTSTDVTALNGGTFTVATASATQFTFAATGLAATTGAGCIVTGATAGADYLFVGANQEPSAVYSFFLPGGAIGGAYASRNTTDPAGGTSAIIVDNDSTSGQASSLYFGTLATSTGICGSSAAYCAIKVTQGALQ